MPIQQSLAEWLEQPDPDCQIIQVEFDSRRESVWVATRLLGCLGGCLALPFGVLGLVAAAPPLGPLLFIAFGIAGIVVARVTPNFEDYYRINLVRRVFEKIEKENDQVQVTDLFHFEEAAGLGLQSGMVRAGNHTAAAWWVLLLGPDGNWYELSPRYRALEPGLAAAQKFAALLGATLHQETPGLRLRAVRAAGGSWTVGRHGKLRSFFFLIFAGEEKFWVPAILIGSLIAMGVRAGWIPNF